MKNIILVALFTLTCSLMISQKTAPDFAVTDIYGHTHKLYSDYLDQNTYVFIDFFVPGCQPCQELAPKVDTVFREFGCNYGEIAFLGIEVYSNDSVLWNFVRDFNTSFPVASGNEGGGHQVFDAYGYSYTPYNIIISPNGEVVSDNPYFSTSEKMRDSLLNMGFSMQLCSGNDFIFYSANSLNDSVVADIDYQNRQINIIMPAGTDLTLIRPTFVNAVNSTIVVNGVAQISGITTLNFSEGPVIYHITSEDGLEQDWDVSIQLIESIEFLNKHISIYPNPSTGLLYLDNDFATHLNGLIQIIDINGKTVYQKISDSKSESIDVHTYEPGIYVLRFSNNLGTLSKKIILQ